MTCLTKLYFITDSEWYKALVSFFSSMTIDQWILVFWIILFSIPAIIFLWVFIKANVKFHNGYVETVDATVCDVLTEDYRRGHGLNSKSGICFRPVYEFEYNGEKRQFTSSVTFGFPWRYPVGKKVKLKYNPDTNQIDSPGYYFQAIVRLIACLAPVAFLIYVAFFQ